MENKNKILEYVEDIIYFKRHEDKEGLAALQREGKAEHVTLEDVGFAFLEIMNDLTHYVDTSQALMEMRLRAVVECLPQAEQIYKYFEEAEDDLFINYESEENDNGTEENN
jgi:hypothetical protein